MHLCVVVSGLCSITTSTGGGWRCAGEALIRVPSVGGNPIVFVSFIIIRVPPVGRNLLFLLVFLLVRFFR